MLTIGVDAHKRIHMAVAIDNAGREVARWRGPNSRAGWEQLAQWGAGLNQPRRWGIEGAWNYGRGLAQHLIASGGEVYEVNPRWTAAGRQRARRQDKNDRLDARAVALLVWREAATLPRVNRDDDTAVLDVLVTEREGVVAEITRLRNQIHAQLLQIDPEYAMHLPDLHSRGGLQAVEGYSAPGEGELGQIRAAAVRRLGQRLRLAVEQAAELAAQIRSRAAGRFSPLTQICGIDLLTAGVLAALLGTGQRFHTDAQLAAYAGVAPLETSSAERIRHRLNRGGNRRLNAVLYRIALVQLRHAPQAKAYIARRVSEGKTRREAMRALKRYIIRAIWQRWQECGAASAAATSLMVA